MNDLNRRIFDLVNSSDVFEKMGALNVIGTARLSPDCMTVMMMTAYCFTALDELIDVPYEENETKILRFGHYLRMVFQQPGVSDNAELVHTLLETAAKALGIFLHTAYGTLYHAAHFAFVLLSQGHLARAGATLTSEIVEVEVQRALEWLEGDR